MNEPRECPLCEGHGEGSSMCVRCNGFGYVAVTEGIDQSCSLCGGSCEVTQICPMCLGSSKVWPSVPGEAVFVFRDRDFHGQWEALYEWVAAQTACCIVAQPIEEAGDET